MGERKKHLSTYKMHFKSNQKVNLSLINGTREWVEVSTEIPYVHS